MTEPRPQSEAILTALERLLAWPELSRSPQLGRFLAYIVQRTLEGNEQSIKAYSIAVDVFGRPPDFDPQADPIVRVQARRLRALLDDYYAGPGIGDVMQIRLPVGRYVPEFTAAAEPGEPAADPGAPEAEAQHDDRTRFNASWVALAVVVVAVSVTAYALSTFWRVPPGPGGVQRPTITVVEFQNLATADVSPPPSAGLAIELVTDLEQFGNIGVQYSVGGEVDVDGTKLPASDYVLTGIARSEGDVVQYSAILTQGSTRSVIWDRTFAVTMDEAMDPDVLDTVSRSLSLVLGSPRGPLHLAARQYLASPAPTEIGLNPYLCRVLFDLYRESGGSSEAERASACFRALPEADRGRAVALAAVAILLIEQPAVAESAGSVIERQRLAASDLRRAIDLDPLSGFVWEQQARLHEAMGDLTAARASFSSSVQLNPASVDALAAYARLLALSGNLAEAGPMARDAIGASPNPPPWYQVVPALLALRDGDFDLAAAHAELYAQADAELGPVLAILAAQGSGDSAVVSRYLPQVLGVPAFRAQGILPRLRERISDLELMNSIRAGLVRAGVPTAALIRTF